MAIVQSAEIPEFKISFANTKSPQGTRKELITVYTIIGFESGNVGAVMDGDLDGFINAYLKAEATGNWAKK